jgi:hypothetical protein
MHRGRARSGRPKHRTSVLSTRRSPAMTAHRSFSRPSSPAWPQPSNDESDVSGASAQGNAKRSRGRRTHFTQTSPPRTHREPTGPPAQWWLIRRIHERCKYLRCCAQSTAVVAKRQNWRAGHEAMLALRVWFLNSRSLSLDGNGFCF